MADGTTGVLEASQQSTRPPVDDLFRAIAVDGVALRDETDPDEGRTLFGHFAVFNRWTEIDSWFEGHFMERIAPGAFKKSFRERQPKVLFQHGHDRELADRVIASLRELTEDETGAYYEARLLDGLPELVLAGLREGEYGASFRFSILKEEFNQEPGTSPENPKGLPERTIKELRCNEFGPVTFPAYEDATAGVRSLTDELNPDAAAAFVRAMKGGATTDLRGLIAYLERRDTRTPSSTPPNALPDVRAGTGHSDEGSRTPQDTDALRDARAGTGHSDERSRTASNGHYGLNESGRPPSWAL